METVEQRNENNDSMSIESILITQQSNPLGKRSREDEETRISKVHGNSKVKKISNSRMQ